MPFSIHRMGKILGPPPQSSYFRCSTLVPPPLPTFLEGPCCSKLSCLAVAQSTAGSVKERRKICASVARRRVMSPAEGWIDPPPPTSLDLPSSFSPYSSSSLSLPCPPPLLLLCPPPLPVSSPPSSLLLLSPPPLLRSTQRLLLPTTTRPAPSVPEKPKEQSEKNRASVSGSKLARVRI